MEIDFPSSPSLNQIYTFSGKSWVWNGYAWLSASSLPVGIGVISVNGITGAVGLTAGNNIEISQTGNTLTVSQTSVIDGGAF